MISDKNHIQSCDRLKLVSILLDIDSSFKNVLIGSAIRGQRERTSQFTNDRNRRQRDSLEIQISYNCYMSLNVNMMSVSCLSSIAIDAYAVWSMRLRQRGSARRFLPPITIDIYAIRVRFRVYQKSRSTKFAVQRSESKIF